MPVPLIAAGVGAAASIGGSVLAAKSAKKATSKAVAAQTAGNDAALEAQLLAQERALTAQREMQQLTLDAQSKNSQEAIAAQTKAAEENRALYGEMYDSNFNVLAPYSAMGLYAAQHRNALLGLPTAAAAAPGTPGPMTGGSGVALPQANIDQKQAFENFLGSTGYQFQLGEGLDAVENSFRISSLDSGAAKKAAVDYANNVSRSYFSDYMGLLGQQQGMGLSAGQSIAGVGNNYAANMAGQNNALANSITGINSNYTNALSGLNMNLANAIGGAALNSGNAIASNALNNSNLIGNAALANAGTNNALYGSIASSIGQAAGAWGASSYKPLASTFGGGGGLGYGFY